MNGSPSHLLLGSSSQGLGASDAVTRALPGAGLGHLDRTPAVVSPLTSRLSLPSLCESLMLTPKPQGLRLGFFYCRFLFHRAGEEGRKQQQAYANRSILETRI